MKTYPNVKVDALINGHISIEPSQWTEDDFLALAIAALDQGGVSARGQVRVAALIAQDTRRECVSPPPDEPRPPLDSPIFDPLFNTPQVRS